MRAKISSITLAAAIWLSTGAAFAEDAAFDLGIELTASSDYMDSGLTNSDHDPSLGITLSPSYGIFYGTIYGANIDYGTEEPRLETKFAIGATPEFGKLAVDFNLARRIKFDDPSADRWLPYVTATYTLNDNFNASLGSGYYLYDDKATADFWELYGAFTVTHDSGASFLGEVSWEPDSDGANNAYYGVYGTATVPFMEKWEAVGKIGYEGYEDKISTAPYIWYEARLSYNFNDHIALGVAYHGNDLSNAECATQAYTDCDDSIFAALTLKGNLSDAKK
jgi:hypothetical protein